MKLSIIVLLLMAATPFYAQAEVETAVDETAATQEAEPVEAGYARPDPKQRRSRYIKSLIGPASLGRTVVSAGFATARNSPPEWGGKWEGFGKRVASGYGKKLIKNTVTYGLDEALGLDSRFYRSRSRDAPSRIRNALISPVTARTESGKRVVGLPRIAGTYSASIISAETWYPRRYNYRDGLKGGSISLGMNAAFNLVKEFVRKK